MRGVNAGVSAAAQSRAREGNGCSVSVSKWMSSLACWWREQDLKQAREQSGRCRLMSLMSHESRCGRIRSVRMQAYLPCRGRVQATSGPPASVPAKPPLWYRLALPDSACWTPAWPTYKFAHTLWSHHSFHIHNSSAY
ncbi:hypothetical protein IE81DRAFT_146204 [Ceraceosorus guamensis]|uniref:Uncharacterized protein n=1 Tax=Ceraceosorus guamensis TaxID=1522189 RepID=A0A316VX67_9BASI|nr:hypothetical protein IE81DRAFT_146204 [Ceraceosorus guamensis]PWN42052.1 hypothetical protein IE81DRAFT_146204 [Ceraceosorus guamensis]